MTIETKNHDPKIASGSVSIVPYRSPFTLRKTLL
jgi:hypothetical protein